MHIFIQNIQNIHEISELIKLKSRAQIIGKPCMWAIIALLNSTKDKTLNITSLISNLNSNYSTIIRCIEYMRAFGMIQEIRLGRIRLIQLNCDNEVVKAMIDLLNNIKISDE